MKKRMALLDGGFIRMDRTESPQHGTVTIVFRIPDGSDDGFPLRLADTMRQHAATGARFNWVLSTDFVDNLFPAWKIVSPNEIDLDFHFRVARVSAPGGETEFAEIVSRISAVPLDMSRPAWEVHLITELSDRRFAILLKMHHAIVDGMTILQTMIEWLSADPAATDTPPLWAFGVPDVPATAAATEPNSRGALASIRDAASSLAAVAGAAKATINAARHRRNDGLHAPYAVPKMAFNKTITPDRSISMTVLDQSKFKAVASDIGGTLNDAVGVVLGTALRRYLADVDERPDRSLVAGVLTSLRTAVETTAGGNVISFIFADLATDTDDIADRAQRVVRSTRAGKEHLLGLGKNAMRYSMMMLLPYIVANITGTGHRMPLYNIAVSNLPGSRGPLYLNGAAAEAMHPTTIIYNGAAVVLVIISWNGKLCFTFNSCPTAVPRSDRLGAYLADAIATIEGSSVSTSLRGD
ncbi:wax ester/triacylglycerol synthase domain-containing protein [Smaragdicoccus niigatensis]